VPTVIVLALLTFCWFFHGPAPGEFRLLNFVAVLIIACYALDSPRPPPSWSAPAERGAGILIKVEKFGTRTP
jgi:cation transport ATPase